jgi:hypothetical protein
MNSTGWNPPISQFIRVKILLLKMVASWNPFLFLKHRFHILHFPNSTGLSIKPTGRHYTKYWFSPDIVALNSWTFEREMCGYSLKEDWFSCMTILASKAFVSCKAIDNLVSCGGSAITKWECDDLLSHEDLNHEYYPMQPHKSFMGRSTYEVHINLIVVTLNIRFRLLTSKLVCHDVLMHVICMFCHVTLSLYLE